MASFVSQQPRMQSCRLAPTIPEEYASPRIPHLSGSEAQTPRAAQQQHLAAPLQLAQHPQPLAVPLLLRGRTHPPCHWPLVALLWAPCTAAGPWEPARALQARLQAWALHVPWGHGVRLACAPWALAANEWWGADGVCMSGLCDERTAMRPSRWTA